MLAAPYAALVLAGVYDWGALFAPASLELPTVLELLVVAVWRASRASPASRRVTTPVPLPREPIALAAPDAGPNQCRVCGLDDLAWWAVGDELLEQSGPDAHVVAYGTGRAHRDCAAVRPYVVEGRQALVERLEKRLQGAQCGHHLPMVLPSDWTVTPLGLVRLVRDEMKGSYCLGLDRDPGRGSFRLGDPVDAGRFDVVTVVGVSGQYGSPVWFAHLAEPLRHGHRAHQAALAPIPEERLFNHDADRPYTHVEMGMVCDCGGCAAVLNAGPPIVRHTLRASMLSRVLTSPDGGLRCEFPDVPSLPPWTPDPRLRGRIEQ